MNVSKRSFDSKIKDTTLSQKLGYTFKDSLLLEQALTHRSLDITNNERLEFLGDAILGAIIASILFQRYPLASEGALSHTRATLVCEKMLANLAKELTLDRYLRLGNGEKKIGYERPSLLADVLEAIIGAIYLDGGFFYCEQCILNWYQSHLDHLALTTPAKDSKSMLQEYLQAHQQPLPQYHLISQTGASHQPRFEVSCLINSTSHHSTLAYTGTGKSRRQAEQDAAEQALMQLQ